MLASILGVHGFKDKLFAALVAFLSSGLTLNTGFGLGWPRKPSLDRIAGITAFKAVLLEGLDVVFSVIAVGAGRGLLWPASLGAPAVCALVPVVGAFVHRPLSRVPENTLKFGVGVLLSAFTPQRRTAHTRLSETFRLPLSAWRALVGQLRRARRSLPFAPRREFDARFAQHVQRLVDLGARLSAFNRQTHAGTRGEGALGQAAGVPFCANGAAEIGHSADWHGMAHVSIAKGHSGSVARDWSRTGISD